MQHKHCFATTNCTIGDIKNDDESLFSGIPVLLGGAFAQTMPVVPDCNRAQQVRPVNILVIGTEQG